MRQDPTASRSWSGRAARRPLLRVYIAPRSRVTPHPPSARNSGLPRRRTPAVSAYADQYRAHRLVLLPSRESEREDGPEDPDRCSRFVAAGAPGHRLPLWSPDVPEQKYLTVADRAATWPLARERGTAPRGATRPGGVRDHVPGGNGELRGSPMPAGRRNGADCATEPFRGATSLITINAPRARRDRVRLKSERHRLRRWFERT